MRSNPYINAISASLYIGGVVLLIQHIASLHRDTPDNWIGTAAAISIVVFSAAMMGFLFFYYPIVLLLDNKRRQAINFFLKTLFTFGTVTIIIIFTLLYL